MLKLLGFFRGVGENGSSDAQISTVPEITDDQPRNPYNEIQLLPGHSDLVHLVSRLDETRFITAGQDNIGVVWRTQTGERLFSLKGHQRPITCVLVVSQYPSDDFDSDEEDVYYMRNYILTASTDKTIRLWDFHDGECLKIVEEHHSEIKCFIRLKDDGDLLYCSGGRDICLWNSSMKLLHGLHFFGSPDIKSLLSIKDNKIVAATDKDHLVIYGLVRTGSSHAPYELQVYTKLASHRESITYLVHVSDAMFASASLDGTIVVWTTYHLSATRQFNFQKTYLSQDPEEQSFKCSVQHLFVLEQRYIFATIGSGFSVFDAICDKCVVRQEKAHHAQVNYMALVNEGSFLATCSSDGTVRLWGAPAPTTADEIAELKQATTPLERLIGKRVKEIRQSPASLELIGECAGHSGNVQMAVYCGTEGFVSSGTDGLVILWKDGRIQQERRDKFVHDIVTKIGLFSV